MQSSQESFSNRILSNFRSKCIGVNTYDIHTKLIFDHTFKGTVAVTMQDIQKFSPLTNGKYLERILDENLYSEYWSLSFPPFHRFFEDFEEKTQQLITAGIVNYHLDSWIHNDDKKKFEHLYAYLKGPQVLTMAHLEAGFVIWLVSVSLAIFSFLLEWLLKLGEFLLVRLTLQKLFELV